MSLADRDLEPVRVREGEVAHAPGLVRRRLVVRVPAFVFVLFMAHSSPATGQNRKRAARYRLLYRSSRKLCKVMEHSFRIPGAASGRHDLSGGTRKLRKKTTPSGSGRKPRNSLPERTDKSLTGAAFGLDTRDHQVNSSAGNSGEGQCLLGRRRGLCPQWFASRKGRIHCLFRRSFAGLRLDDHQEKAVQDGRPSFATRSSSHLAHIRRFVAGSGSGGRGSASRCGAASDLPHAAAVRHDAGAAEGAGGGGAG